MALLEQDHLLRLRELSRLQAVEINAPGDVGVPRHLIVSCFPCFINKSRHNLPQSVENPERYVYRLLRFRAYRTERGENLRGGFEYI